MTEKDKEEIAKMIENANQDLRDELESLKQTALFSDTLHRVLDKLTDSIFGNEKYQQIGVMGMMSEVRASITSQQAQIDSLIKDSVKKENEANIEKARIYGGLKVFLAIGIIVQFIVPILIAWWKK